VLGGTDNKQYKIKNCYKRTCETYQLEWINWPIRKITTCKQMIHAALVHTPADSQPWFNECHFRGVFPKTCSLEHLVGYI